MHVFTISCLIPVFHAKDVRAQEITMHQMQEHLIRCVFSTFPPEVRSSMAHQDLNTPVCGAPSGLPWRGLSCSKGVVTRITFIDKVPFDFGQLKIEYLPSALQELKLCNCQQAYAIDTRLLPRSLKRLDMAINKIYGSFDFGALPRHIEEINLGVNAITGTIALIDLPCSIREINIAHNPIKQRIVFCQNIPKSLKQFTCWNTGIARFESIDENEKIDSAVFSYSLCKKTS